MRKEDRIRQQRGEPLPQESANPQPRQPDENVKGSGSGEANRPPREPGKLPLPELAAGETFES